MLLMVEKEIRSGWFDSFNKYAKADNKCITDYDKNKESWYLKYLDANNLYGWAMSQESPLNGLKWVEDLF